MQRTNPSNRPIISVALRPRDDRDWIAFQKALDERDVLGQEHSSSSAKIDAGRKNTTLYGKGELELEMLCDRILDTCRFPLEIGTPEVIYVETIRKSAEGEAKYIRQLGGRQLRAREGSVGTATIGHWLPLHE